MGGNNNIIKNNSNNNKNNNYVTNIKNNFKIKKENNYINQINKEQNICDLNIKNYKYKKIGNYYLKRNINANNRMSNKKEKEKKNILLFNKQKIISADASSLNSHVSRLLNLKKLKCKNNFYNTKNFKEKFKVDVINRNNSEELKNLKNNKINGQKYLYSTEKQMLHKSKYNMQYNNYNINKKENGNDDTPSISTLIPSKKYISNSMKSSKNLKEDKNSNKYRVGLLSAYNSNKNILIPLITLQRPLSNFNIGVQLNKEKKNSQDLKRIKMNLLKSNIRQKISTAPARKREGHNYLNNEDKKKIMDKKYNNLFGNMNIYDQKYHHIKIDRSLISNKMKETLSKSKIINYMGMKQKKFPKIKKKYKYDEIKKMIQINNSTKN